MDASMRTMLTQTVYLRRPTGYSPEGDETLSAPVAVKAYIETRREVAIHLEGDQLRLKTFIITEDEITKDDLVYLPGTDTSSKTDGVLPDKVTSYNDLAGNVDHYEVQL